MDVPRREVICVRSGGAPGADRFMRAMIWTNSELFGNRERGRAGPTTVPGSIRRAMTGKATADGGRQRGHARRAPAAVGQPRCCAQKARDGRRPEVCGGSNRAAKRS